MSDATSKIFTAPSQLATNAYDYIIVGGGSAGCVLANKLSSNSALTVLLIESGSNNAGVAAAQIPLLFSQLFHTKNDWDYNTTPQDALAGRSLYWPRGKILGGCSSMNAMMVTEGAGSDYDQWTKEGVTGWTFSDLKPIFRLLEDHVPRDSTQTPHSARGVGGPRSTGYGNLSPICSAYLQAATKVGIKYNRDVNTGENPLGGTEVMTFVSTQGASKGQRSSSATAFLTEDVLRRSNLTVLCETSVLRVIFSESEGSPKASGVEVATSPDSETFKIQAKREIILSAGAINTPKLLLLSGIGPEEDLKKVGVPVVYNSAVVGKNLLDHPTTGSITFRAKPGATIDWHLSQVGGQEAAMKLWMETGKGVFSSNVAETTAFFRSTDVKEHPGMAGKYPIIPVDDWTSGPTAPDVEVIGAPTGFIKHGSVPVVNGFTLFPILLAPQSHGFVQLKSSDPWAAPIIDPKTFSHPNDVAIMTRALRLCLRIARCAPLVDQLEIVTDVDKSDFLWLGSRDPDLVTDAELKEHIVNNAETNYHPAGTARMGTPDTGVLDSHLRVYGVRGLRVCDASALPTLPAGHPDITVCGIAYLQAERMLADESY
ncbi:GMC oxidoreductase [Calocera viscosa TUFC12733]|uniref:GMC oxidoreductase n=1 Tax=Calocera viscosa (strain TUFC12733) TaxID=1330018 RepID=A0A167H9X2_CALVF|nr:GMC oxidoreductase [Calocera viscosa TUFC12733]